MHYEYPLNNGILQMGELAELVEEEFTYEYISHPLNLPLAHNVKIDCGFHHEHTRAILYLAVNRGALALSYSD